MLDLAGVTMERSRGEAAVGLALSGGATRLVRLRQAGSAKAILPRAGAVPEVVFLNTSGGLTGGDRLDLSLALGEGAAAVATTQTAERAYASAGGTARVSVAIRAGARSRVAWLPQETILFERSALHRTTRIELGAGAAGLFAEAVVLGRAAMGETPRDLRFRDERIVLRGGRPVFAEPLVIDPGAIAVAGQPAILGGARAFATVALVAQGAEDAAGPMRALLDEPGVTAAASGFDGRCVVRLTARDGWPLRRQILRVLARLSPDPLPRVWPS